MSYDPYADQDDAEQYGPPSFEPPAPPVAQPSPQPYAAPGYTAPAPGYAQAAPGYAQPAPGYAAPAAYQQFGHQPHPTYPPAQPGYAPYGVVYPQQVFDDPNSPGAPLRGATPLEALQRFWRKGITFTGRASLSEYWWMAGWQALFYGVLIALVAVTNTSDSNPFFALLLLLGWLACLIPNVALGVRRMHDTGNSGWMLLLGLVPYIGGLIMLIYMLLPGKPEGARYDY